MDTARQIWATGALGSSFHLRREPEILFGQVREDPSVEIAALESHAAAAARAFCIGSGGCTALSLLAVAGGGRLEELAIVDINPAQSHLVSLKLALARRGDLALFRTAIMEDARPAYAVTRDDLTQEARAFWDARPWQLASGLNRCGAVDRRLEQALQLLYRLVVSREAVDAVLTAPTLEVQRLRFDRSWDGWRWRLALKIALSRPVLRAAYGAGFVQHVPRWFADLVAEELRGRIHEDRAVENGYLWQAFRSRYPPESEAALPPYLQEANRTRLASGAAQAHVAAGDAAEYLDCRPPASVDLFAFSNILDSADDAYIAALFAAAARAARPGAVLCLRSFFPHLHAIVRPAADASGWKIDREGGAALERRNRSPFCTHVLLFRRATA